MNSEEIEQKLFDNISENPAQYIRYYRELCGLTQTQLSKNLIEDGVSINSIQGHEYGLHRPHKSFTRQYVKFFSRELALLIEEKGIEILNPF